jgi:hypothetical protein
MILKGDLENHHLICFQSPKAFQVQVASNRSIKFLFWIKPASLAARPSSGHFIAPDSAYSYTPGDACRGEAPSCAYRYLVSDCYSHTEVEEECVSLFSSLCKIELQACVLE